MSDIARAIAFAAQVHEKQYDKGGEPYILHPIWVMQQMNPEDEHGRIVALLHDVIEDATVLTLEVIEPDLSQSLNESIGQFAKYVLEEHFGGNITDCVRCLSHGDEDYLEEYIPRVLTCSCCTKVKMHDLEHNLNPLRQPQLRDKDLQRLQKYHMAYRKLRGER